MNKENFLFSVHFPETLVISSTGQAAEAVPTCLGRSLLVTFVTCFTVFKFNPKTSVHCRFSKMSDLFVNGRPVWEQVDGDKFFFYTSTRHIIYA